MAGKNDVKETKDQAMEPQQNAPMTALEGDVEKASEAPAPQQEYVAPEVKDLSQQKEPAKKEQKQLGVSPAPIQTKSEPGPTFRQAEGVITISKLVNAKGTAATDVILARIEKHMKHLGGQLGFRNEEEKAREQLSFIETVGNTLRLDFPQYALVTDVLLNNIKANQSVFDKGLAFRFVASLGKNYPADHVKTYQTYMSFLAAISKNWAGRSKLGNLVDVGFVTKDFPQKAKENVTQYFRRVTNG